MMCVMVPPRRTLRILHVIGGLSPRAGGPTNVIVPMCQALADRGHEVHIMCTNGDWPRGTLDVPTERTVLRGDVKVTYYPLQWGRYAFSFPLAVALQREIPRFDVVHIHSLYLFHTLVAAHYCRRYGIPYILRPHGTLDPYQRRKSRLKKAIYNLLFEHRNLHEAAAIHYTTVEEQLRSETMPGLAPGVVVPHGLNLSDFPEPTETGLFRRSHPETANKKLVTFLGRLTPKKGLDLLVRAFGHLARARGDVHLVMAGPDDEGYGSKVRGWLAEEQVLDQVTFPGMLVGSSKLELLYDTDVFVLASYFENFGVSVLEALGCRRPVVVSEEVYIWREIKEAEAGIVVPCRAGDLEEAIVYLLDNPELARIMGERGRSLVESRFTWDAAAKQLEDLYFKVTGRESRLDRIPTRRGTPA